jgi:RimJ/RimL family protein N-acetyltransferase
MPDAMQQRTNQAEPIISHDSVFLRPAERTDIPLFVSWLTDARTTRTLALVAPLSLALEEGWFEAMLKRQGSDNWHFVICPTADDRPVGIIDLHDIDMRNGSASLGITIGDPDDTGEGYGTAALLALVGFAFGQLRLERVELEVYDFNARARRVYERVGFILEGTRRRALFRDGAHHDVHLMAILRDEWTARSGADRGAAT